MGVIILGTAKRYSSLDTYSEEFRKASGYPRIILRLSKNQARPSWDDGTETVDDSLSLPITDGWTWNILRGNREVRSLRSRIAGNQVHYTTFGLPLLTEPKISIVTIHDLFFLQKGDESCGKIYNLSERFLR